MDRSGKLCWVGSLVLILCVLVCHTSNPQGQCCSHETPHVQEKFQRAAYVVKGKITDINNYQDYTIYAVEVRRVYKGDLVRYDTVQMKTLECDPDIFEPNGIYLISATSEMVIDRCLWNSLFTRLSQYHKTGLRYIYNKHACELIEAGFFDNAPPSARCFYDVNGGECERQYSSCIEGPDGYCSWDQTEEYDNCINKDLMNEKKFVNMLNEVFKRQV